MIQAKFIIDAMLKKFLLDEQQFWLKDESALMCTTLERFENEVEHRQMIESAALYAELYAEDAELQELSESALTGWPA